MKSFSGAKIQDLEHYVTLHLEHEKPGFAVIHIGSNNVSCNNLDIDASVLVENIMKIGNKCINYGVEEVVISFIIVKVNIRLSSLIRKVNGKLHVLCSTNKFHFISDHNITRKYLCIYAKLHAYGLSKDAVTFVYSYAKCRKQGVKINDRENVFQILFSGIP